MHLRTNFPSSPDRGRNGERIVIAHLVARALPLLLVAASAHAEGLSKTELAKLAQNPIANLISVPFQNNTNFDAGPFHGAQNVLNIQPVIPVNLNEQWNLINRTIMPLISNPTLSPAIGAVASQAGQLDLGPGPDRSAANPYGSDFGQRQSGPGTDGRAASPVPRRSLGLWC